MVSDDLEDEHLLGLNDLSPFIDIGFPMVYGFNLDPIHLTFAGCFKRRLKGLVSVTTEGKKKSSYLASVGARLKFSKGLNRLNLIGMFVLFHHA